MQCDTTVETPVHCVVSEVAPFHIARKMEVQGVSTHPEPLTHFLKLGVFDTGDRMLKKARLTSEAPKLGIFVHASERVLATLKVKITRKFDVVTDYANFGI
jgi:hypothetical protein